MNKKFICYLLISFVFLSGCNVSKNENNILVNTIGNINNYGYVAEYDDWLYYANTWDDNKLYKVKKDGTEKTKLLDESVSYINTDGEWIYCNVFYNIESGDIWKIRIDGSEKYRLTGQNSVSVFKDDEWIYYNDVNNGGIYKVSINGGYPTRIFETLSVDGFIYYDDSFYYFDFDDFNMKKINLEGEVVELSNNECYPSIIINDSLYYKTDGNMYKMSIDGSEETFVTSGNKHYLNYLDNWIFFCNGDDSYKIYRMNIDGTEVIKLNDVWSSNINIIDGWVYYRNNDDAYRMYRMRPDGTNKEKFD